MSLLAPLLKPRSLPPPKTIASRSMPACVHPSFSHRRQYHTQKWKHHDDTGGRAVRAGRWQQQQQNVEDIFINALVMAGSCRQHRPRIMHDIRRTQDCSKLPRAQYRQQSRRNYTLQARRQNELALANDPPEITRKDYQNLVDIYNDFDRLEKLEAKQEAKRLKAGAQHQPLAPRLVLTPEQELLPPHAKREILPPRNAEHGRRLRHFVQLCRNEDFGHVNVGELWEAYEALPTPRPKYISDKRFRMFFRHLSWVEYKHQTGIMEIYFALLNECIGERVRLPHWIWTTAVQFAGRYVRNISSPELKNAIEMWMRMEEAGHQADLATFTILFQVAVKAERFALAETIFEEVKQRGIQLDRIFRIQIIHYAGARRDGDKVRQAFRDLVNAGEIVDTGVMNAVILGLFRAGEHGAAEHVYLRMKALHEQKFGTEAPRTWQIKKELAKLLNDTSRALREEKDQHEASFFGAAFSSDDRREQIQKASPIAPDDRTYQILIKYHAYTSGELDKIMTYFSEMEAAELQVHGSVYVHILRGFHMHGGYYYSNWGPEILEALWKDIITQMDLFQADSNVPRPETSEIDELPVQYPGPASSNTSDEPDGADDYDMLGAMMSEHETHSPLDERPSQPEENVEKQEPQPRHKPFNKIPPQDERQPEENVEGQELKPGYKPFDERAPPGQEDQPKPDEDDVPRIAEFERRMHMTRGLAIAAVSAFNKCIGRKRTLEIWEELLSKWKHGSKEEKMQVQRMVDHLTGR